MGTFLVLILESAICLALFYLLYKLMLSKDTFHRFNRVALLSMLLLSAVIPVGAILLEGDFQPKEQLATIVTEVQTVGVQVVDVVPVETPHQPFPLTLALLVSVYAAGVLFFSGRLLRNRIVLTSLMRKCTTEKLDGRTKLFTHNLPIAPFSWMRSIVVSSKDLTDNKDIILTHELAHIQLGHSWDLLVTDLCILVQWFNPAVWLLRQELQAVHEFEADDNVLHKGIDAKKYQLLIIEKAVGTRLYSMANSFNHGSLKKRITMMLKEKSSPWARAKYAVVLPLAAVALMGFARPEFTNLQAQSAGEIDQLLSWTDVAEPAGQSSKPSSSPSPSPSPSPQDKNSGNSENPTTTVKIKSKDKPPLVVVDGVLIESSVFSGFDFRTATQDALGEKTGLSPSDIKEITVMKGEAAVAVWGEKGRDGVILITTKTENPKYPGGDEALNKFIQENLKYPTEAFKEGIQGKVICSFVIDATGKVTDIKVTRSVDPALDAEAVRVLSSMPNWIPGKQNGKDYAVQFALPIMFSIQKK